MLPDSYRVNERGRFVWLQRIAFNVLRRFGQNGQWDRTTVCRERVSTKKLAGIVQTMLGRIDALHRRGKEMVLLVGPQVIEDTMSDMTQCFSMTMQHAYGHRDRPGEPGTGAFPHFYDLPVVMVPWMDGAVIVPRDDILRLEPPRRGLAAGRYYSPAFKEDSDAAS